MIKPVRQFLNPLDATYITFYGKENMNNYNKVSNTRVIRPVWDRTTRCFHWINVLCVFVLSAIGTAILYEDNLGFSNEGIILLKTVHVYTGYVFTINLLWRLGWAFFGNVHARWRAILPFRSGYILELCTYVKDFRSGTPPTYLGHNPLARLMVTLLLMLMLMQASSGLILAGTDLYKPPFGGAIAKWVTNGDAERLAQLKPGSKDFVDLVAYKEMRTFRKPVKKTHEIGFYLLLIAILIHIVGVIITEIQLKQGLISGMFTGHKVLPESPKNKD